MIHHVESSAPCLSNARLIGRQVVMEPIQPKDAVMKKGGVRDLLVHNEERDMTTRCMCVIAEENEASPYELHKRIKEAICGDVYTGFRLTEMQNNDNDNIKYMREELVVIKVISMKKVQNIKAHGKLQEDPLREIAILQMFEDDYQNVCCPIDCIRDEKYIYLIMNHHGDEIFNRAGKMSEKECRSCFHQIINGVQTMQRYNVCHRDLSLENILISDDGKCTIIDFGMSLLYPTVRESDYQVTHAKLLSQDSSTSVDGGKDDVDDKMRVVLMPPQGTCGKKNYIAPEVLTNLDPFNGAMVDNWALGVILFMLLTGRPPFHKASPLDKWYRMIQQGKLREMLTIWQIDNLSEQAITLLQKLLRGNNHNFRMTTDDILNDSWLCVAEGV
jgi:serine/threonine protein kinase